MTEFSKTGVRIVQDPDGSYHLEFANTPKGREAKRRAARAGSPFRDTYIAVYDNGHNRQFKREKQIDQYARIQSFKDQCLIENIIKRCLAGDETVLSVSPGFYGDISAFPSDPRSFHELLLKARSIYEAFPEEQKIEEFGGSFDAFLSTFGDGQSLEGYLAKHFKPVQQVNTEVQNEQK